MEAEKGSAARLSVVALGHAEVGEADVLREEHRRPCPDAAAQGVLEEEDEALLCGLLEACERALLDLHLRRRCPANLRTPPHQVPHHPLEARLGDGEAHAVLLEAAYGAKHQRRPPGGWRSGGVERGAAQSAASPQHLHPSLRPRKLVVEVGGGGARAALAPRLGLPPDALVPCVVELLALESEGSAHVSQRHHHPVPVLRHAEGSVHQLLQQPPQQPPRIPIHLVGAAADASAPQEAPHPSAAH
eukprot:CAMPEP_0177735712 /NCGR_PEP_ID=MMETSP0484_2-20121128/24925_1 /TAXON_ID=354590 /ORGANISM="Rhodomonas lens, Strain RHODO" /LENGTH=244 /DNA_ID=CAMNT_0019249299 /DNA_START=295 /DNA_END=1026 /DNA_ORIENTATION=+